MKLDMYAHRRRAIIGGYCLLAAALLAIGFTAALVYVAVIDSHVPAPILAESHADAYHVRYRVTCGDDADIEVDPDVAIPPDSVMFLPIPGSDRILAHPSLVPPVCGLLFAVSTRPIGEKDFANNQIHGRKF